MLSIRSDNEVPNPTESVKMSIAANPEGQYLWARGIVESDDAEYMHCGEPMQPRDNRQRSIFEPISTESLPQEPVDVQLETTVLRCACGFQLEIPA